MHPDLAGRMGQHPVPICQFYTKHGVWQILFNRAFNLNRLFLCHSALVSAHLPKFAIQKRYSTELEKLRQSEDLSLTFRDGKGVLEVCG